MATVAYKLPSGVAKIEVSPAVRLALESTGRAIRRNNQQYFARHRALKHELTEARGKAPARDQVERGSRWEGPWFRFTLFLGLDRSWPIPGPGKGPCAVCRDAELPVSTYCLWCNRSGRDLAIPKPTPAELSRLQRAHPNPPPPPEKAVPLTRKQRRAAARANAHQSPSHSTGA